MVSVPAVTLQNGLKMPLVGFGLWKVPADKAADTVYNAIKTGYRLLDGAAGYGNEKQAGEGLKRAIKDGIVKREDVFVTKIWNSDHKPEHVRPAFLRTLNDWDCGYIDLYLQHFPYNLEYVDPAFEYPTGWIAKGQTKARQVDIPLEVTWAELEKIQKDGLAKNIGISNYTVKILKDFLPKTTIKPAVLQVEHHPYLQQPELIKFAKDNGIAITAYSSFGGQSYIELKQKDALNTPLLLEHQIITSLAQKHKKTPAQILLRWATQRGVAVIPKSNNQHRLEENLHVSEGWSLEEGDFKEIEKLDLDLRFNDPKDDDPQLGWLFAKN